MCLSETLEKVEKILSYFIKHLLVNVVKILGYLSVTKTYGNEPQEVSELLC